MGCGFRIYVDSQLHTNQKNDLYKSMLSQRSFRQLVKKVFGVFGFCHLTSFSILNGR
jgi:hypothetical protein